ncbi:MAG: histidine--tRNA ligase [Nanoarchaeota archaeon]|nr:histidine--tRNA ligase [Nanoarchaeota archaeon]
MKTETVKGFRDIENASKRFEIRKIIEETFKLYGFEGVETPVVEYEEFVKGENSGDDAVSDIFKLEDKGKRKLALRYEFTFQLKRLAKNKKLPWKRYQIGEVFRDEPVKANRWRQFTQCDIDTIGSSVRDEAEILKIVSELMDKLGIKVEINVNNRKLLNEIIDELKIKKKEQVMREIDKLDKLDEKEVKANLKKYEAEKIIDILKKPKSYFKKYESYNEIEELEKYCKFYNIKINFVAFLVRGLSYYNGSVFEIKVPKVDGSVAGGGSYLVNGVQSTGIAFGLDRIEQLANVEVDNKKVLIISIGKDKETVELADKLRGEGVACVVSFDKVGKALEYANSYSIPYVVFVGEEEVKKKKFKLKDMGSGEESFVSERDIGKKLRI